MKKKLLSLLCVLSLFASMMSTSVLGEGASNEK